MRGSFKDRGGAFRTVLFAANTTVMVDAKGNAITVTLAGDVAMEVAGSRVRPGGAFLAVILKRGAVVSFDNGRNVTRGVLATDTMLKPSGSEVAELYKAGTVVTFDNQVRVASSTPPAASPGGNAAGASPVNETTWIVYGTPDPWIFHRNGTMGVLSGKWKGTWRKQSDGDLVTITNQGITDQCVIVFSPDGNRFRGMRNEEVWRTGVRQR